MPKAMGGLRLSCGKEGGVWVETFQPSPRFSLESMAGGGGLSGAGQWEVVTV